MENTYPTIGAWYKSRELEGAFEVVAIDLDLDSIELQFIDGDLEEIDLETWEFLESNEIGCPDDWSLPYEISKEDLESYGEMPVAVIKDELLNYLDRLA